MPAFTSSAADALTPSKHTPSKLLSSTTTALPTSASATDPRDDFALRLADATNRIARIALPDEITPSDRLIWSSSKRTTASTILP